MNLKQALELGLSHIRTDRRMAENNLKHAVDPKLRAYLQAKIEEYREAEQLILNAEFVDKATGEEWRDDYSQELQANSEA